MMMFIFFTFYFILFYFIYLLKLFVEKTDSTPALSNVQKEKTEFAKLKEEQKRSLFFSIKFSNIC
jgi:uncharacterized membrane protein SpoIIM required for sporulation